MRLRALEIADLPYLYQWENDAEAWSDSELHNPLSQKLLREYIEQQTGDIYRDGQLRLIIEDDACRTLGAVDLFDLDPRSRKAAIGMYIAPAERGRGVGNEAVRLLIDYAFRFLALHQIYAIIADDNVACATIYRHAGFTPASRLTDWVLRDGRFVSATIYQLIASDGSLTSAALSTTDPATP